jgi:hypothetical protein
VISRIIPLELAPSFSYYYYVSYTSVYGSTTPRYAIQRCVARQPIREPQADKLLDVALSTNASHAQFIEYSGNVDQRQCQCHERIAPRVYSHHRRDNGGRLRCALVLVNMNLTILRLLPSYSLIPRHFLGSENMFSKGVWLVSLYVSLKPISYWT